MSTRITLNLRQAKDLVTCFGDEDVLMTVGVEGDGHSGPGLYCWESDYPDEGVIFLPADDEEAKREEEIE